MTTLLTTTQPEAARLTTLTGCDSPGHQLLEGLVSSSLVLAEDCEALPLEAQDELLRLGNPVDVLETDVVRIRNAKFGKHCCLFRCAEVYVAPTFCEFSRVEFLVGTRGFESCISHFGPP